MIQSALDLLLLQYAAGGLEPSEALMAASLRAINPEARRKVARFEAMGGCMMDKEAKAAVSNDCLSAVLALIDAPASAPAEEKFKNCAEQDKSRGMCLPDSVHLLISEHCPDFVMSWRETAEGVEMIDLKVATTGSGRLNLIRARPHSATPQHSHDGIEITLVLNGSYIDGEDRHRAGDIVIINDHTLFHAPRAGEEGCVCLILTDGSLHFAQTTPQKPGFLARFFKVFQGG